MTAGDVFYGFNTSLAALGTWEIRPPVNEEWSIQNVFQSGTQGYALYIYDGTSSVEIYNNATPPEVLLARIRINRDYRLVLKNLSTTTAFPFYYEGLIIKDASSSIGTVVVGYVDAYDYSDLRPPSGEVWAITLLSTGGCLIVDSVGSNEYYMNDPGLSIGADKCITITYSYYLTASHSTLAYSGLKVVGT